MATHVSYLLTFLNLVFQSDFSPNPLVAYTRFGARPRSISLSALCLTTGVSGLPMVWPYTEEPITAFWEQGDKTYWQFIPGQRQTRRG